MEHKMEKSETPIGKFEPPWPECSVVFARDKWFGISVNWIEHETFVGWLRLENGVSLLITRKYGIKSGTGAILYPDGGVIDRGSYYESLGEWWQQCLADQAKYGVLYARQFLAVGRKGDD
jgi:hypothetical protein